MPILFLMNQILKKQEEHNYVYKFKKFVSKIHQKLLRFEKRGLLQVIFFFFSQLFQLGISSKFVLSFLMSAFFLFVFMKLLKEFFLLLFLSCQFSHFFVCFFAKEESSQFLFFHFFVKKKERKKNNGSFFHISSHDTKLQVVF